MTEASTSYRPATGDEVSSESSTFIESSSAYHNGKGNGTRNDSDHEDDGDDDDDDEKLFAELDKELDLMEDESNFDSKHQGDDSVANFDMAEFRERRMEQLRQE